ncbi:MAG: hypothetical protein SOX71_05315 [Candidatus Faecousia sp.]|nr:hypothetical protein [Candidatus Faecousia sp.]
MTDFLSEPVNLSWCTKAIQIQTGIGLYGFLHIIQDDGSGMELSFHGHMDAVAYLKRIQAI